MAFFTLDPRKARRLYVFPHAGGSDQEVRRWTAPADVDLVPVVLPGRGRRFSETPYRHIEPLVEDLLQDVVIDRPTVFYGHSLGASVALALLVALRDRGQPLPERLVVGARPAPQHPVPQLSNLTRDAFVEALQSRYGGIPEALLAQPGFLDPFLGAVRADFRVLESVGSTTDFKPLELPIRAIHGTDDPHATAAHMADWASVTTGRFELLAAEGGHFFHAEHDLPALALRP